VRLHDGRHTAITTLAEKGLPDWVIQAQVGHVAPEMVKTYSHIRRQALNQAAAALEPLQSKASPPSDTTGRAVQARRQVERVMSQSTSQSTRNRGRVLKFSKGIGWPHWTISATG
jgi:Phage integrase family